MAEFKLPSGWNLPGMDLTPQKVQKIESIPAAELHHYENHVFQLYEDERKSDMIESIKENGILTPLIVREKGVEYEILAGHNRFECGKAAGITEFPCIIKNVDDEEAELIVTVTNLHQRSLSDMSHSQMARAIKTYYNAVKSQGKRNDLLNEMKILIETAEKADEINENSTSRQVGEKLNGAQKAVDEYGLSARTISRYLRISELNEDFLELLDDGKLSTGAAVDLSYLSPDEQNLVYRYITDNDFKIDMKKAKEIRSLSKSKKLNEFSLPSVWTKKQKEKKKQGATVKLKREELSEFFTEADTDKDIIEVIKTALRFYFENEEPEEESDEEDAEV